MKCFCCKVEVRPVEEFRFLAECGMDEWFLAHMGRKRPFRMVCEECKKKPSSKSKVLFGVLAGILLGYKGI